MHDAYSAIPVLEKLPLNIQCIACYGDYNSKRNLKVKANKTDGVTVLVGTKEGHLLIYKVLKNPSNLKHIEVNLERSNRFFSKKPIQQLFVSPQVNIIVSLSDGIVSVFDLTTYQLITCIQRTKGATLFTSDLEEQISSTGDSAFALKLCVSVKRKLQCYFWKNQDFVELHGDVSLPDIPKTICWCKDSVCVGFKREYGLVKLDGRSSFIELSPTGKLMEPVIGKLDQQQLVLMKDETSIFINSDGDPTFKHAFTWSDNPLGIDSQPPYLIGILPKYIEVRTVEPRHLIQSIDLHKPRFSTAWRHWLFIASVTHIWALIQLPLSEQIHQLLKDREFELALQLAKRSLDDEEDVKTKQIQHIHTLLAFELFCQKKFEESLENFLKLKTDPAQVIGLFPDLLPTEYKKQLIYPYDPPVLKGSELEKGLLALIEFLTEKRNETIKHPETQIKDSYAIVEGNTTMHSKRQILQVIDTTLLKCYLKTNDALVAPLLRLPDNHCHVEEAERVLKRAQKHRELIELYKKKGLHQKALKLLLDESNKNAKKSDKSAYEYMIKYMQHLGKENVEIIFEFAPAVLKAQPLEGLQIFTGDTSEVESLPKKEVLDFLDSISHALVVAYLEHVIFIWDDSTSEFHNRLATAYKDKTLQLLKEHHDSLPEEDQLQVGCGPIELTETRGKLLTFLEISTSYQPERILPDFPTNRLLEERAILLGRLGYYQQALALYANVLKDPIRAESYCVKIYNQDPSLNKDVFFYLLKMYLKPESLDDNFDHFQTEPNERLSKANLNAALRIMYEHSNKLDPSQVLGILPELVSIANVQVFLRNVMESQTQVKHEAQVLNSLLLAESQQINEQRIFHENSKCVITDERVCRVCKKKIGVSAFARYPNDVVVHYFCCKDRKILPVS
uniref:Vam6/Vps39-like protein n=1 Tax=Phallusia mammillata TaxID=59560 RepID=A0A6F9DWU6_9ASCI|nr:vam6/Vps39-like protein [Phallusia mammillata]